MIAVTIKSSSQKIKQITISGHAYSGEPGFDLVCAGVSTLGYAVLNTLDYKGAFKKPDCIYEIDEGFIDIQVLSYQADYQVILETLMIGLMTVEESHNDNLKITKVEV